LIETTGTSGPGSSAAWLRPASATWPPGRGPSPGRRSVLTQLGRGRRLRKGHWPFPYRRAIRWCSDPRRKASLVNSAGVVHEQIDPGPSGGTENLVRLHVS
jgi:hypothetical protein